jgi:hypothetical protein
MACYTGTTLPLILDVASKVIPLYSDFTVHAHAHAPRSYLITVTDYRLLSVLWVGEGAAVCTGMYSAVPWPLVPSVGPAMGQALTSGSTSEGIPLSWAVELKRGIALISAVNAMTSLPYRNTGLHFADYSLTMSSKKVTGLSDSLTAKQQAKQSVPRIEERYYLPNKHL